MCNESVEKGNVVLSVPIVHFKFASGDDRECIVYISQVWLMLLLNEL